MGAVIDSLWRATTEPTDYPPLAGDVRTEVVVVGVGITGLTTAYNLKRRGFTVTVIESNQILTGTTGGTTGNLTSQHGMITMLFS